MFMPPSEADRLVEEGNALLMAGQVDQAADRFRAALRLEPNQPMALTKLAEIALLRKDHVLARDYVAAAMAIEPNFAPAWGELSLALWLAGQRSDALVAARRSVEIQPPNPRLRLRLAQFAAWMGHGDEARLAVAPLLAPNTGEDITRATAISLLGELAVAEGRFHEADPHLLQALALAPGLPSATVILGMNQLRRGNFADGWINFAAREPAAPLYPDGVPPQLGTPWTGQDLRGKSILVADDQGHGDSIQFFRYLPMLKALGPAAITLRSFPPLVRLLAQAAPYATVTAALPPDARFDVHCTSTNLPRWFGTTAETIPAPIPYLGPPDRLPLAPAGTGLNVGLAWSGDARHTRDHLRSIPAACFLTLADLPGFCFHSLQHQVRPEDRPALEARPAIRRAVEDAQDFADTAALIAGLDLVITVDTAIAHLAGAMGKPVWVLLHVAPDWRWQAERADSPWYPTARLFRLAPSEWGERARRRATVRSSRGAAGSRSAEPAAARSEQGWEPLVERVAAALRDLAGTPSGG